MTTSMYTPHAVCFTSAVHDNLHFSHTHVQGLQLAPLSNTITAAISSSTATAAAGATAAATATAAAATTTLVARTAGANAA
eukprot:5086-Heterococcus_DN1.PRE.2